MAEDTHAKMIITIDVDEGKILNVLGQYPGSDPCEIRVQQFPIPDFPKYVGVLLTHPGGSNCVTLALPGGGSYTVCH